MRAFATLWWGAAAPQPLQLGRRFRCKLDACAPARTFGDPTREHGTEVLHEGMVTGLQSVRREAEGVIGGRCHGRPARDGRRDGVCARGRRAVGTIDGRNQLVRRVVLQLRECAHHPEDGLRRAYGFLHRHQIGLQRLCGGARMAREVLTRRAWL